MSSYSLEKEEVILYESGVTLGKSSFKVRFTLTSKNIFFEKEKGIFKKKLKIIESIPLEKIKMYKDKVQIKQKKTTIKMQTMNQNIEFSCDNIFEAKKIVEEIINLKTDSTILERTTKKAGNATKIIQGITGLVIAVGTIPHALKELNRNKKEISNLIKNMLKR